MASFKYKPPFPWFGGKSRIAQELWGKLGNDVVNFVDPFTGSAAFLMYAPKYVKTKTINDMDGYIVNFWRAVAYDPAAVAKWADWPVVEADLFARQVWLLQQKPDLMDKLYADPDWYDAKIAGWWVWGACGTIAGTWCSGDGAWWVQDGKPVKKKEMEESGIGVNRGIPHLGNAGQGINRQNVLLEEYITSLSEKLRYTRITCGDWTRVLGPSVTTKHGVTAVILDPPYGEGDMDYNAGGNDTGNIASDVWKWAIENGNDPLLRIAVCGYADGREVPQGWAEMKWKARKGYQKDTTNSHRETIWLSPHCVKQASLFGDDDFE